MWRELLEERCSRPDVSSERNADLATESPAEAQAEAAGLPEGANSSEEALTDETPPPNALRLPAPPNQSESTENIFRRTSEGCWSLSYAGEEVQGVKPIPSWNSSRLLIAYAAFFFNVVVSIFSVAIRAKRRPRH